MNLGIHESCNAYFATCYRRILDKYGNASEGMDIWSNHAKSFGLGEFLNNDLYVGQKGRIPDSSYYEICYRKNRCTLLIPFLMLLVKEKLQQHQFN